MTRFERFELRTTDRLAAERFYATLFGAEFWASAFAIVPLPEPAIARGASPHWVGYLGVDDVVATAARMIEEGGQALGPAHREPSGASRAVLRDPFGAIVGLTSERASNRPSVAWHAMQSRDHEKAFASYSALFGWTAGELVEIGGMHHRLFSWDASRAPVGSVSDGARLPTIHTQWLFLHPVADLEASMAKVRALGGLALEPVTTSRGDLVVPCDDAQGAAFGLFHAAP